MSRYRFVTTTKAEGFPVQAACEAAEVSTSAYDDWTAKVAAGPTEAEWDEALIVNEMHDVHAHHDDTYGSPRMTSELPRRGFRFKTRAPARHAIPTWIKHDNATRLHSSLGNLPPIEWELRYRLGTLEAA